MPPIKMEQEEGQLKVYLACVQKIIIAMSVRNSSLRISLFLLYLVSVCRLPSESAKLSLERPFLSTFELSDVD